LGENPGILFFARSSVAGQNGYGLASDARRLHLIVERDDGRPFPTGSIVQAVIREAHHATP